MTVRPQISDPQKAGPASLIGSGLLARLLLLGALCPPAMLAQAGATLASVGYQGPRPAVVAPGQVITLFVTGATIILPRANLYEDAVITADRLPLPTSLGGFSAAISQSPPFSSGPVLLPIFSVAQSDNCPEAQTSDCMVTALTVQMPAGLQWPRTLAPGPTTAITILQNGVPGDAFSLVVYPVNPHIITTCSPPYLQVTPDYSTCPGIVTHADGTYVSPTSPAQPGETVVLYAFGLGPTIPAVAEGTATPAALIPAAATYSLAFSFQGAAGIPTIGQPVFAGLTPGEAGLYQVNFTVPVPSGVPADCSGPDSSNLYVQLYNAAAIPVGNWAFQAIDATRICVGTAGATAPMALPH